MAGFTIFAFTFILLSPARDGGEEHEARSR